MGGGISDVVTATKTRGAVLGLREACAHWTSGSVPHDLYAWRNAAIWSLRRDLDLIGLEHFDPDDRATLLNMINKEMEASLR